MQDWNLRIKKWILNVGLILVALPSRAAIRQWASICFEVSHVISNEEEIEVKGGLTYLPPVEVLPKTKRTELMLRRKAELKQKRIEEAEALRKQKEQEEAQKRMKEQEAKKLKAQQEAKRKEEERRRREEEEQRKQLEGGLDRVLEALNNQTSQSEIILNGLELGSVRLRLLSQALSHNLSCLSINISRKFLTDEDGVSLAGMLQTNHYLEQLLLEGNNLGAKAAAAMGEALGKNNTLKCLNLENNNLTANGNDQAGVVSIAKALSKNPTLAVLNLSKNHITSQSGEYFARCLKNNGSVVVLDLSGNEVSVNQQQEIEMSILKNRARLKQLRMAQRRERIKMQREEEKETSKMSSLEIQRDGLQGDEERRLKRAAMRMDEWKDEGERLASQLAKKMEQLMQEAEDRKDGKKGKKKKK